MVEKWQFVDFELPLLDLKLVSRHDHHQIGGLVNEFCLTVFLLSYYLDFTSYLSSLLKLWQVRE